MILATRHGDRAVRSVGGMFQGVDAIPTPAAGVGAGSWSVAGRRVTPETAAGLPAILRGVRLIAETIASFPLQTIARAANGNREPAEGSWQWDLLHDRPNDTQKTPFAFKEYVVASMVMRGNSYSLKAKSRGRVQALYPLRPSRVEPRYLKDGESLVYDVRSANGKVTTLDAEDLLHIPGFLLEDPLIGQSPIKVAANAIGTSLGVEEFAGRFFENDGSPGGVLNFTGTRDSQAAKDTRDTWEDRHRGSAKARRIAALFGGTTYQAIGVDAESAQLIESQRWSVEQAARVLGLPAWALGGTDQNPRSTPEQRNSELMTLGLGPWVVRFEEGLHADDDLFPDKSLFPHLDSDHLVRAEMLMRYQAYTLARQAGWLSINDVRGKENMPPIDDGDDYQVTPVGGAPNQQPGGGDGAAEQVPADPTVV